MSQSAFCYCVGFYAGVARYLVLSRRLPHCSFRTCTSCVVHTIEGVVAMHWSYHVAFAVRDFSRSVAGRVWDEVGFRTCLQCTFWSRSCPHHVLWNLVCACSGGDAGLVVFRPRVCCLEVIIFFYELLENFLSHLVKERNFHSIFNGIGMVCQFILGAVAAVFSCVNLWGELRL